MHFSSYHVFFNSYWVCIVTTWSTGGSLLFPNKCTSVKLLSPAGTYRSHFPIISLMDYTSRAGGKWDQSTSLYNLYGCVLGSCFFQRPLSHVVTDKPDWMSGRPKWQAVDHTSTEPVLSYTWTYHCMGQRACEQTASFLLLKFSSRF